MLHTMRHLLFTLTMLFGLGTSALQAAGGDIKPAFVPAKEQKSVEKADNAAKGPVEVEGLKSKQYAVFPVPLQAYKDPTNEKGEKDLWETLKYRAMLKYEYTNLNGFNLVASIIFVCAILHTFLAGFFMEMAHKIEHKHQEKIKAEGKTACAKPQEDAEDDVSFSAHLFHFLGEVEAIFGIWVIALAGAVLWFFGFNGTGDVSGFEQLELYLGKDINFTEPLFVIIVMAIAATRPIIIFSEKVIGTLANCIKGFVGGEAAGWWISVLTVAPILGSFITEPAAITIAAILLSKKFFDKKPSAIFAYATLGLLFVNISVGGTLTHFAAPPVLMVVSEWKWDMAFMFINYGWKAVIGILIANTLYFFAFRKHFASLKPAATDGASLKWIDRDDPVPAWIVATHLGFLAWTVLTLHYPPLFIGGFLFFLGFTQATKHHQNKVQMKTPLLVGFFLGGLVIHGKCQAWWIAPVITSIDSELILMIGSTILTAFNDNAAITYLASQAPGLSAGAKYAVVAGAVTGGGLTVIANAPNPAGQSILGKYFDGGVAPAKLAMGALIPTIIMGACFMLFKTSGMTESKNKADGGDKKTTAEKVVVK